MVNIKFGLFLGHPLGKGEKLGCGKAPAMKSP